MWKALTALPLPSSLVPVLFSRCRFLDYLGAWNRLNTKSFDYPLQQLNRFKTSCIFGLLVLLFDSS